jgi:hypothetical protein
MDTGLIVEELNRSRKSACVVARNFTTTPVIPNEENSARMSVQINPQLEKRLESVNIVMNHLSQIHLLQISAVRGNVGLPDRILKYGQHVHGYLGSVFSAGRSFGVHHGQLKNMVVNIAQNVVVMMPTLFRQMNLRGTISTPVLFGRNFAKKFLNVMVITVKTVGLMEMVCIFTISKFVVTVAWMKRIILCPYVILATERSMLACRKLATA